MPKGREGSLEVWGFAGRGVRLMAKDLDGSVLASDYIKKSTSRAVLLFPTKGVPNQFPAGLEI